MSALEVIGRASTDPAFAGELMADVDGALVRAGYALGPPDVAFVKSWLASGSMPALQARLGAANLEQMLAQMKRARDLQTETLELFSGTLGSAKQTYRGVTWMTQILFGTGIALFAIAALWGLLADEKVYSLVFGGLGGAAFAAIFITGPIDKAQTALSNLIQSEVAFMNYYEQITMWENFVISGASVPGAQPGLPGTPGQLDAQRLEEASSKLQKRTEETMALLQKYLEPAAKPD